MHNTSSAALSIALDRPMPQSLDAERAVLGSIIINNHALMRVWDIIGADDFFKDAHRVIYAEMLSMEADGLEIETLTLRERLISRGALERAGGTAYISSLIDSVPDVANVERYAGFVRERSQRRALVVAGNGMMREALDGEKSVSEIRADFELALARIGATTEGSRDLYEIVRDAADASDERVKHGQTLGVMCQLPCINNILLGFQRGALTTLAANTSVGKTAFGLQVVEEAVTVNAEVHAVSYQVEMTERAIALRYVARNTHIELARLREWKCLNFFERERVRDYINRLADLKRRLHVGAGVASLQKIITDMKRLKAQRALDIAVVDYLQLVTPDADERTREREVSYMAWRLTEVAQQLDIAMLALSQVTVNDKSRLTTESLRESKAIGHHSRTVLILDRPWQMNKADDSVARCYTTLQIEKHSEGETGDFPMHFDGRYQLFTEGDCPTGCPFAHSYSNATRGTA